MHIIPTRLISCSDFNLTYLASNIQVSLQDIFSAGEGLFLNCIASSSPRAQPFEQSHSPHAGTREELRRNSQHYSYREV